MTWGGWMPVSKRKMPISERRTENGRFYLEDLIKLFRMHEDGIYTVQYGENSDGSYILDHQAFVMDGYPVAWRFDGFHFIEMEIEERLGIVVTKDSLYPWWYSKSEEHREDTLALHTEDLYDIFQGKPTYEKYIANFRFYDTGTSYINTPKLKTMYGFPVTFDYDYQVFQYGERIFLKIEKGLYRNSYTLYEFKTLSEVYQVLDDMDVIPVQSLILRRIDGSDIDKEEMDQRGLYRYHEVKEQNLVDPLTWTYTTLHKDSIIDGHVYTNKDGGSSLENVAYYPLEYLKADETDKFEILHTGGSMNYIGSITNRQHAIKRSTKDVAKDCIFCDIRAYESEIDNSMLIDIMQNLLLATFKDYIPQSGTQFENLILKDTDKIELNFEPAFNGQPFKYCHNHGSYNHTKEKIKFFNDLYPHFKHAIAKYKEDWRLLLFAARFNKRKPVSTTSVNPVYLLATQTLKTVEEERIHIHDNGRLESDYYV